MDIELSGRIGQLLNELVESILPKETEASVAVKYKSYISRILSSRIGGESAELEENIVSRLKEQAHDIAGMNLKNDNWGLRRGERLQECLTRLGKLKSLKNRPSVLKLVGLLSSNKNSSSIKAPMFLKSPPRGIQEIILRNSQQLSRSKEQGRGEVEVLKTEDAKKAIVRELLFTFQGIESSRLQFNKSRECYEIDPRVDLEKNEREMLTRLCELGVLYQRIKEYLDFQAVQIKGLISQSLSFAIKEELNEYYRFIATLENMRDSSQEFGTLTLKSLYLWTIDPIECLRWILILCDVCRVLKGGQILSALFSYSVHGCPDVESLVNRLITKSLAPFMNFLKNWVYHGELVDPMGEFFILLNKKELPAEQVWAEKYRLNTEMIPNFISYSIAEKILNTGKSKTFLRKFCNNSQSTLSADFITVENLISFRFMEGLKFRALENWVQSVHKESNLKLKEVIIKDFDFFGHCKMIKSFLLQGKGDFINLLLESMQDSLEVSASSIFRYNLVSLLDSTKAQISLSGYNKEYLGRLGIFLFDPTTGDKGWDIFSLKYELDSPLSTIFEPGIMKFYFTLFNHIWKMRNLIYLLNNSSKAYSRIFLQNAAPRQLIEKLEHFNRMRHQMLHFLNTFLSYLMLEVIETEWNVFQDAVKNADSLDDIINRHRDFITAVMQKSMLSSKSNEMYKQLKELLKWIEMFTKTQNTHLLNIESNILPQRQSMVDEEQSVDFEEDGDGSKAKEDREAFQIDVYKPAFKLIGEVWRNFWAGLDVFLQDLETDQKMKTLSFRLDFNEYYKLKRHLQGGRSRPMIQEKPAFKGHSDS